MRLPSSFTAMLLLTLVAALLSSYDVSAFSCMPPSVVSPRCHSNIAVFGAKRKFQTTSLGLMRLGRNPDVSYFPFSAPLEKKRANSLFGSNNTNVWRHKKLFLSIIPSIFLKLRRSFTIIIASTLLYLGPVSHVPLTNRPMAHASTLTMSPKSQKTLDKLIDKYVQRHMFDDDKFDPLESTYREIINDSESAAYPNALSSIASNLGATQTTSSSVSPEKTASNDGIMKNMLKLVNTLETKYNVPRSILLPVLVLTCFGVPSCLIFMGLLSFSFAQRGMTERMAIERYGESVLDAEELPVEEDEDDDFNYEAGEYDDDDDDDKDDDEDED